MRSAASHGLTTVERAALIGLARAAIADRLLADGTLDRVLRETELTPSLKTPRGAFVTLRTQASDETSGKGPLRGCIGTMTASDPLYRAVIRSAQSSAFEDPRFSPITASEVDEITIEISALTPLAAVDGPETIVVGRDGVQLEKDRHRAVFLPQVATEQGWDTTTLLENLCVKAGLPRNAWKGARLEVFQAEVFAEAAN
jgi:AmmeMemoRadiSam system protein A